MIKQLKNYGYRQSDKVEIDIVNGSFENLEITATHPGVHGVYKLDHEGRVFKD